MSPRFPGSIARQRSSERDMVLHQYERVWDQLPVNNKHRMSRSNATDRSEDLRCAVVAAVVGVSLVVLGTSLVWFADLAAVQLDQLTQVQAAQDAWDSKFSAQWKLTEWELFINGTTAGRLTSQPKRAQILDDEERTTVASSKKIRQNLIGSALSYTADDRARNDEGNGRLFPEIALNPVNVTVRASAPDKPPQMLQLYTGPLVWSTTRLSNSWKSCHYAERGHWQSKGRTCTTWWLASQLCVKTHFKPNTGLWEISTRYGGPGCSSQRPAEVLSATRMPVLHWRNSTPPHMDSTQAWKSEVALYEAHDPYLFVANLTGGSMMLAESSSNGAAFGIMAIVFGSFLLVPYVLMKALDAWETQRRKRLVKFSPLSFDEIPLQQCTISKF